MDSGGLEWKISEATIVAAKEQVSSDLAGEVVILNFKTGVYYGLDAIGARIWNLLQKPQTVKEIQDAILKEYEVEPDCCERDIMALLQELSDKGLIEVKDEQDS